MGGPRRGQSVTSRAFALLAAFDEDHRRLRLTDLAERAGLPRPTAHRLLAELVAWGALVRGPSGHYAVGRRIWELGLLAPQQSGLVEIASPFLNDLYGATRSTVHLAVREGEQTLYLDRLRGTTSVPVVSTIGSRLPLHTTGVGKVLLAHAPEPVRRAYLAAPLKRVTPYSIIQPGTLQRQLERTVEQGWATTTEEMSLGACSIAVPIRSAGEVVAALGVVVPTLQEEHRLVAALQVAAGGIGRSLP